MHKKSDSRGLSTIVATLLIILLTLVAVGIIWIVVRNVLQNGAEEVSLGKFTLNLEIKGVRINPAVPNYFLVTVKRNAGAGDIAGLKFIIYDGDTTEVVDVNNFSMKELEEKMINLSLQDISNASNIKKVSVAPIFKLESGKEVTGDIKDEYTLSNSSVTSEGTSCTPNCVGKQCGSNGCSGTCGTCTIGTCNLTGQCVISAPIPAWQTGLVSWWKFNGDATDSVGMNDGTVSEVTLTSTNCKFGQCYGFDGVNKNITIPSSNTLDFPVSGTVSLWVNALTPTSSFDMPLWRGGGSIASIGYDFELGTGSWYTGIANGTAAETCRYSTSPLIGLNMLTFTFDTTTNKLTCYVNGINTSSGTNIPGFGGIDSSLDLYFGETSGGSYDYNGTLDEVMIWNRALNLTEVSFLYNSFDYSSTPVCTDNNYSECYHNDVYWYDSCGGRGSIRYDCTSTQTCTSGACINNPPSTGAIIIDHTMTNVSKIPTYWITAAKNQLIIAYQHTSHGYQITTGLSGLEAHDSLYSWTDSDSNTSDLTLDDLAMSSAPDLGYEDNWAPATRTYLDAHPDTNVLMWSWCSIAGHNITKYLENMKSLIIDYPNVKFMFITGHAEGGGEYDSSDIANRQIRDFINNDAFCDTHQCILFDFSDIENYDPDNNYFLDKRVEDGLQYDCVAPYDSGDKTCTWSIDYIASHPTSLSADLVNNHISGCAHSPETGESSTCELNCALKGQAAWWMFARLAGWDGVSS